MAARRTGSRKPGLGRGLEALLPLEQPEAGFAEIPIDRIGPNPQQPRHKFDSENLTELADSIREVGVLQPVLVRKGEEEGSYVLVAGERRLRAAASIGLEEIPAVIRSEAGNESYLTEALIENVQRTDLGPLEEAAAYRQLMEDFSMTHELVAQRVGKSRSAVSNTVRLLQLPAVIQGMVERNELSAGHARALLAIDDEAYAIHVAERAVTEGWPVRRVEEAAKARTGESKTTTKTAMPRVRPPAVIELEQRLAEQLDAKVSIDYRGKGGKLVVRFTSIDDLERIYRRFLSRGA